MLADAAVPGSDAWWLFTLANEMGQDFKRLGKLQKYRTGDAAIPEQLTGGARESTLRFFRMGRLHVADLIVQAKTSRQKPIGFRTAVGNDDLGDDSAWLTWKRSGMQVAIRSFFDEAGHYGRSYLQVTDADTPVGGPVMMAKTPWEVYARKNAFLPAVTDAAIQVNYDELTGRDTITLYRQGYFRTAYRAVSKSTIPTDGKVWRPGTDWVWIPEHQDEGSPTPWPNSTGILYYEAPDGMGFYEKHLDSLDRINDGLKQRITIIAMQAFKQRALKGELPATYPDDHPLAGQEIDYNELFKAGPAALWMLPDDVDIWESAGTDITPLLSASKDDLKHLAAVTATPLYVLQPDATAGSAEGASLARETLTFSVEDLNGRADAALALAHALAFRAAGDESRGDAAQIETIWASIDRASWIERAQAAAAASTTLSQSLIEEKIYGLSPAEMKRAEQDRSDKEFLTPAVNFVVQKSEAEAGASVGGQEDATASEVAA